MENNKPLPIILEDSKKELILFINNLCNKNNLNYYFLDMIVNGIYEEIKENKDMELKYIQEEYSKQSEQVIINNDLSKGSE